MGRPNTRSHLGGEAAERLALNGFAGALVVQATAARVRERRCPRYLWRAYSRHRRLKANHPLWIAENAQALRALDACLAACWILDDMRACRRFIERVSRHRDTPEQTAGSANATVSPLLWSPRGS